MRVPSLPIKIVLLEVGILPKVDVTPEVAFLLEVDVLSKIDVASMVVFLLAKVTPVCVCMCVSLSMPIALHSQ